MLINGEKFACEACVRGHRTVFSSTSTKKVVPCHNANIAEACESLARNMSSASATTRAIQKRTVPTTSMMENTVRLHCKMGEQDMALTSAQTRRPAAANMARVPKDHPKQWHNKNAHDPKTTIFTNGHHKPVHRFNDAHNQLGTPYKIPSRSNSLHGQRELAQRSTDNLLLTKSARPFHESPLHNSITEAMQIVERKVRSEHNSPVLGPTRTAGQAPMSDFKIPSFDPRSYAYSPFSADTPPSQTTSIANSQNPSQQDLTLPETFPDNWFMTYDQAHQYEPPAWSRINDGSSVDWTNLSLDLNNGNNNNSIYNLKPISKGNSPYLMSQPPTFQHSHSDLANQIHRVGVSPSSGEHSEAEEPSPNSNTNGWNNDRPMSNELSSPGGDDASEHHRLSSASSYFGTPQASMLADDDLGSLAIDDFLKQAEAETKRMQMQNQLAQMQMNPQDAEQPSRLSSVSRGLTPSISTPGSTGTGEHSYTVKEAMRFAHPDVIPYEPVQQPKTEVPPAFMADDPSWSAAPDMSDPRLVLDDERDDENWVR
ncbi:hypothetical protein CLCR_09939 [Cladophialophora carrionii]|uniref:Copper-fist domain-containing protein n=1 Tax=Cladophialophora carrionii TaxID=86049 RepID=A0A1C1CYQ1_9EURO|nr:hypothetical protein CLCR_09939 [Cladophialophora carrionii]